MTHITLWRLQAAPLLIGADMSQIDRFTTDLLGNREVLAVDQDPLGKAAKRVWRDGDVEVWARPLSDGAIAVGLFNRGPVAQKVAAKWSRSRVSPDLGRCAMCGCRRISAHPPARSRRWCRGMAPCS